MSPGIVAIVLFAAAIHVTWNLLLKTASEPLRFATVANTIGAFVMLPAAVIAAVLLDIDPPPPRAYALAGLAGVLEVGYFSFLTAAYRRGDVSVVYPIARGTAPLLSVMLGITLLGERLGTGGYLGVALLLSGVLAIRRPWQFFRRAARVANPHLTAAVGFAFATGMMIASYSAVDRTGARETEPWLYEGLLSAAVAVGLWIRLGVGSLLRRDPNPAPPLPSDATEAEVVAPARDPLRTAAFVGVASYVGYGLILFAYNQAPLTAVAPMRESAVVFASGWGTLRLGEGGSRIEAVWRIGGALLVVAGIFLLGADGR